MSRVELRERWRDSPERARSFCTVLAAISLARRAERPWLLWLRFTCSYWRARFVPFLIPRGGIWSYLLISVSPRRYPTPAARKPACAVRNESGELALQDLAGRVARQRVEELHLAGNLVAG